MALGQPPTLGLLLCDLLINNYIVVKLFLLDK